MLPLLAKLLLQLDFIFLSTWFNTRSNTFNGPAAFEKINETLILDAAHNPHAAEALVKTWQTEFPKKKADIIFGAVEDKSTDAVLSKLSEIAKEFHFVPVNFPPWTSSRKPRSRGEVSSSLRSHLRLGRNNR